MSQLNSPVVLPPNKVWKQVNNGNIFGSIFSSRNIDLSVPGVLSLSRRAKMLVADTAGTDLEVLMSVVFDARELAGSDELYYLVSSEKVYQMEQDMSNITPVASSPALSSNTDGVIWNDGLYVTDTSDLSKLVAGVWTHGLYATLSTDPHPLCVSSVNNYLLIGDGNLLRKRTTAGVNSTAITLPGQYEITWIRSNNNQVLIGTRNMDGGDAAVFEWDEVATGATNKYEVDAQWVLSGCFRSADLFVMLNDGRLQLFNGAGFDTVAQFPPYIMSGEWTGSSTYGAVTQRGMAVINGKLHIAASSAVNGDVNDDDYYENFPAGIWMYDEETGLNHRFGYSMSFTTQDFAQMRVRTYPGAIARVYNDPSLGPPDLDEGTILIYGARVYDGSSTGYYSIGTLVEGVNRGEFATTRIESAGIANDALKLWVKFRGLLTAADKILFKIKDSERLGMPFNAGVTYTSTTVFTSTDTKWANALVGDEVTIMNGKGGGAMAHITNIAYSAPTYTVTLDEAIPNVAAAEVTEVIVDNYRRLEIQISSADTLGYKDIPLKGTIPKTWFQIKTELRGSERVTIEEMQILASTHVLPSP